MTGSQPRLDWLRFELVGGLVIFLGQLQKRVDRPIVIEAERDAAAMFGLLPKPGYLLVYHPPTGTKQGKISIASALDPPSQSKAPAGDGRRAGSDSGAPPNIGPSCFPANGEPPR